MQLTTTHRNRWFYVRLLMTALLAAMLVIGRLPAAGALDEAPAGDPVELQAAQTDGAPVDGATELPTEDAGVEEAPTAKAPAHTAPVEEVPAAKDKAPTHAQAPKVTVDEAPAEDTTLEPSTTASTVQKKSSTSSPQLAQPAPALDDGDVTTSGKVTLQQWKNKPSGLGWRSGNLGTSNSRYTEGDSVAFRTTIDAVSLGSHTLQIQWDTTKGGNHSFDYLTGYNFSEAATPCDGQVLCSMSASGPAIPHDSTVAAFAAPGQFAISGGTVTGISAVTKAGTYAGDSSASVIVTFNATAPNVVLAWGGHISSPLDWGPGNTAGNISGSSYHMRVLKIDNAQTGNQDRSLAANAVIPAPMLSFAKGTSNATPAVGQAFNYTLTLTNTGTAAATGVNLSDTVPSAFPVTGVSQSGSSTGTCAESAGTPNLVECSNLTVPAKAGGVNGVATVTITIGNGPTQAACDTTITNTATITPGGTGSDDADVTANCPNVSIVKSASDTTPQVGSAFSYSVVLTNSGTAAANDVAFDDTVPAQFPVTGVSDASASGSCMATGQLVKCSGFDLAANGGTATVTITIGNGATQAACDTTITNTATLTAGGTGNDDAEVTATCSNVTIDKTASDATPRVGTGFSYSVVLTNGGSAAANDVAFDDTVPAQFPVTGVSDSSASGSCTATGQLVECSGFDLAANGGTATLTITIGNGSTQAACDTTITNTATLTAGGTGSDDADVTATCPDVDIVKSASDATPRVGASFTFSMVVTNNGSTAANDVAFEDDVPSALPVTGVSDNSASGSCTATGQLVECSGFDLAANGGTATVKITIGNGATQAACDTPLTNTATLTAGGTGSDDAVVTPDCPNVKIDKTASDATPRVGTAFSYSVVVANSGTAAADDVAFDDTVPAQFPVTRVSDDSASGSCTATRQLVGCSGLDLAANGGTATVTITIGNGATQSACDTPLTNTATLTAGGAGSDDAIVEATCGAVGIEKTTSNATPAVGGGFTYSVVVTNTGSAAADDVAFDDDVPDEFPVASVSDNSASGSCTATGQLVECSGFDLAANGGTATVTITVAGVTAAACDATITNTAALTSGGTDSDDADVAAVCPAVEIDKTTTDGTPDVGGGFDYTVVVANNGSGAATGVAFEDDVPAQFPVAGISDNSASGSCTATGQLVECSGFDLAANGGTATVTITVAGVTAAACDATITNTAALTSGGTDSDDADVAAVCPAVDIAKDTSKSNPQVGEVFEYTVVLTNAGTGAATGVAFEDNVPAQFPVTAVDDDSVSGSCTATGQLVECSGFDLAANSGTATVTITIGNGGTAVGCNVIQTNTATITAGGTGSDSADVTIPCPVAGPDPKIKVEKTADVVEAILGDVITYTYVITNTGNVTLSDLSLVDDKIPGITIDPAQTLVAGQTLTLTATYTVTPADVNVGKVTNVAVAQGSPPVGSAVTSRDTVSVPIGVTVIEDPGFITVTKYVIGDHNDAAYAYSVDCGSVALGKEATFKIAAKGGSNEVGVGVPVGTQCKVVETDAGGADATSVAVNGGAARDARSAIATVRASGTTVTFTNAFNAAPVPQPPPRPLPDPDPQPKPEPPRTLPATGSDTMMQLLISLAALLLGGTLIRVTRPRSREWLRA